MSNILVLYQCHFRTCCYNVTLTSYQWLYQYWTLNILLRCCKNTHTRRGQVCDVGFNNGGHCFITITSLSHSHWFMARTWLTTFWLFHLCITMASPKMQTFILTWFRCWGPFSKIESLLGLAFSMTKPCTSFKCLVNNHLTQYVTMQVPTLHFHFNPTFIHYVFPNHIKWTRGCQWLKSLVSFKFRT